MNNKTKNTIIRPAAAKTAAVTATTPVTHNIAAAPLTLHNLLTKNETENHLVPLLKELAKRNAKGPWREYLAFYAANLSGDVGTMNADNRKKADKMREDLLVEHFKAQDL